MKKNKNKKNKNLIIIIEKLNDIIDELINNIDEMNIRHNQLIKEIIEDYNETLINVNNNNNDDNDTGFLKFIQNIIPAIIVLIFSLLIYYKF